MMRVCKSMNYIILYRQCHRFFVKKIVYDLCFREKRDNSFIH